MARKMTEMALVRLVEEGIQKSDWSTGSEPAENRKRALDSYYGRARGRVVEGRSNVVSHDTADMVEAVVAQVMPALDFDEVAAFDPVGPLDVAQARIETRVCNFYLKDLNYGYTVIQEALRDALLLRNGIVKVWVEHREHVSSDSYDDLDALTMDAVMQPTAPFQTVDIKDLEHDAETDTFSFRVQRTTTLRELVIEAVDPTKFLIREEYDSIFLDDCDFVGERHFWTRSDLLAMGYNRRAVMELPPISSDTHEQSLSRDRQNGGARWETPDPMMERIEVFEIYAMVDYDGDGFAERRRIIYAGQSAGGTILANDMWAHVPYGCGTGFLIPHRWMGLSLYDKLNEVERIKTETLRQYIDNMNAANNSRLIVQDGMVNIDDAINSRPGGIIRADRVDAVQPVTTTDIGGPAQSLLNYMDKIRSERGGASLDLQAAELQLAGETAHGVERQFTSKEQLAQLITRTLGQTLIRSMFLKIHEALRSFMPGDITVLVGSEFVTATPSEWQPRNAVRIVAGMSAGERQERRAALEAIVMQQEKLAASGMDGILVDLGTYHDTLTDWSSAGGIETPARHWVDPRSAAAQEAMAAKQQQAQQAQQEQQAIQMMLFQTQIQLEQMRAAVDQFKHQTQLQHDYWDATLKSGIEELRIAATAEPDQQQIDTDQQIGRLRAVS